MLVRIELRAKGSDRVVFGHAINETARFRWGV